MSAPEQEARGEQEDDPAEDAGFQVGGGGGRIEGEAVGEDEAEEVAPDNLALGEEILARGKAGIEAGSGSGDDFGGVEDAEAGSGAEGDHGGEGGPDGTEENEGEREGDTLFFGEEGGQEPGNGGPGFLAGPGVEGGEAEERGEEGAAGEEVLNGLGEEGMDREQEGGHRGDVGGEKAAGDAIEQEDGQQVEGEVEQVPAAEGLVEPEGEVGEGAGLFELEEAGEFDGLGEKGVVVEDEDARQGEGMREEREEVGRPTG